MSPEQAMGERVDRRTDIFAVGVMLWNLATGMKLWADLNDVEVARSLQNGDYPASPRELCPDVPEEIDAICRKALAWHPEHRYASAQEMRADLDAFFGAGSADARKNLLSNLKELFVADRAKVRAVLEGAGLTTTATAGAVAAAVALKKERRPVEHRMRVQTPSIGAMVVAPTPSKPTPVVVAPTPSESKPTASASPTMTRGKWSVTARALAFAAAAGVIGITASAMTRHTHTHGAPREPAFASSDVTTFARDVRAKAERPPAVVVSRSRIPGHSHFAPSPAKSATPTGEVQTRGGPNNNNLLDNADPWAPGPAHTVP
jgi:serine/threonine-protein kinase